MEDTATPNTTTNDELNPDSRSPEESIGPQSNKILSSKPEPEEKIFIPPTEEKIVSPQAEDKIVDGRTDDKIAACPPDDGLIATGGPHEEKIPAESDHRAAPATICHLRPRTFWICVAVAVLIVAAIIAGSVAGTLTSRNKASPAPTNVAAPKSSPLYQNSSLAAMQWADDDGTHYRVYFQEASGIIQESAWDSNSTGWCVSDITTSLVDVKLGTPLAAAAGWPHANKSYALVKNVYYMGSGGKLYERQAPYNDSHNWKDDNFSGLSVAGNNSYLAAHWEQDFDNVNQTLSILWQQDDDATGDLTMGKYTSNATVSNPWVFTDLNFSTPIGAAFAMNRYGGKTNLLLYTVSTDGSMEQHQYYTANDTVSETTDTNLNDASNVPMTMVSQNNTSLFTVAERPECSWPFPLTQLLLYPSANRSTLNLVAYNCSSGFVSLAPQLAPVLKENRTYLALSSHGDAKVYVMFDEGDGPEVEEWAMPELSGDAWDAGAVRAVAVEKGDGCS